MSNQLKKVLPFIIPESQVAFVADRQILDAFLKANEIIDDCQMDKKSRLILKLN